MSVKNVNILFFFVCTVGPIYYAPPSLLIPVVYFFQAFLPPVHTAVDDNYKHPRLLTGRDSSPDPRVGSGGQPLTRRIGPGRVGCRVGSGQEVFKISTHVGSGVGFLGDPPRPVKSPGRISHQREFLARKVSTQNLY